MSIATSPANTGFWGPPKVMFFDSRPHGRHRDEPSRWAKSVFWLAKVRTSDGVSRIETKGGLLMPRFQASFAQGPAKMLHSATQPVPLCSPAINSSHLWTHRPRSSTVTPPPPLATVVQRNQPAALDSIEQRLRSTTSVRLSLTSCSAVLFPKTGSDWFWGQSKA